MSIKLHTSSVLPRLIEGISPEVKLESVAEGVRMTVTTKSGSKVIIIPKGEIGETGPQGMKGDTGDTGVGITNIIQNVDGTLTIALEDGTSYETEPLKGETGSTGPQGPKGDTGTGIQSIVLNQDYTLTITYTDGTSTTTSSIRGAQGAQGIQGEKGEKGDTGAKGDQGIQGEKGDKGDKGDTGATGAQGPKGDTGSTGATPQLSIGTVETLDPGDDATVTISGTAEAPVLNFGIPQGDPGEVTQAELNAAVADIDELHAVKAPVITESASGSIASFADGADGMPLRSLSVAIEPVQDLHGYDHPWPGGGGENLLDPNIKFPAGTQFGVTLASADGYTFSFTGTATSTGNIVSSTVDRADAVILPAGTYISKSGTLSLYNADGGWLRNQYSNQVFTVDEPFYVKNLYWEIIEGQTYNANNFIALVKGSTAPTDWTPYSNICPISGFSETNVTRTGVNVWDEEWELGAYRSSDGSKASVNDRIRSKNFIPVRPSTYYYHSKGLQIYLYDKDKTFIRWISASYASSIITPENCYFITFNGLSNSGTTYNNDISINYPSTDTQYHAYSGETAEYEFPQSAGTVYGGTLTIHQDGSGELVVDRATFTEDGSSNINASNTNRFYINRNDARVIDPSNQTTDVSVICDRLKSTAWAGLATFDVSCAPVYGKGVAFRNDEITTAQGWKDYFTQNPTQFSYALATPVTYQLTNQQVIETLKGNNVLWADCGNVTLEYPADTKLYIDGKIAELQALILENISNS